MHVCGDMLCLIHPHLVSWEAPRNNGLSWWSLIDPMITAVNINVLMLLFLHSTPQDSTSEGQTEHSPKWHTTQGPTPGWHQTVSGFRIRGI